MLSGTTTERQCQNVDYLSSSRNSRTQNYRSHGKDATGLDLYTLGEVRTRGKSRTRENHLRDSSRMREHSLLPCSRSQSSKTYPSQENRIRTTGLQAAKSMKSSRKILTEKNGITYGSKDYATNEDSIKTVTKIYSSRKERRHKKTGKLRSDRNDSRLTKYKHVKNHAIFTVSSSTVKEGSGTNDQKNERDNSENEVIKSTFEDRLSENGMTDNCGRKPSLQDSRGMLSLIQSDTETDSVSYDQIPSSNDTSTMGNALSEKKDVHEGESETLMEKKFYDGIYFFGDHANMILSYVFSKENHVEIEAISQVNGEPSRSEF